jgi:hypothetical protein
LNVLALIEKPANALHQREHSAPVIHAADLEEQRQVPRVRDRLKRVAAIVEARRNAGDTPGKVQN